MPQAKETETREGGQAQGYFNTALEYVVVSTDSSGDSIDRVAEMVVTPREQNSSVVNGSGKSIEVPRFPGDKANMFSVLSKAGTGNCETRMKRPRRCWVVRLVCFFAFQMLVCDEACFVDVRGFGRVDNRKEARKCKGEKPAHCVLAGKKLQVCDDFLCTSVWGSSPFGFSFRPSIEASSGLLTIWDTT
jgi:hypothetical protein